MTETKWKTIDEVAKLPKNERIKIAKLIWGIETKTRIDEPYDGSQG